MTVDEPILVNLAEILTSVEVQEKMRKETAKILYKMTVEAEQTIKDLKNNDKN